PRAAGATSRRPYAAGSYCEDSNGEAEPGEWARLRRRGLLSCLEDDAGLVRAGTSCIVGRAAEDASVPRRCQRIGVRGEVLLRGGESLEHVAKLVGPQPAGLESWQASLGVDISTRATRGSAPAWWGPADRCSAAASLTGSLAG